MANKKLNKVKKPLAFTPLSLMVANSALSTR